MPPWQEAEATAAGPDLPFYMCQPPWRAIVSAAIGVACLHAALYSRFSICGLVAVGRWMGAVVAMVVAAER